MLPRPGVRGEPSAEQRATGERLLDETAAHADRDRMRAVAGLEAGEDSLRVGTDRLRAQAQMLGGVLGREAVRVQLQDLALTPGQRQGAVLLAPRRRVDEGLGIGGGIHRAAERRLGRALGDERGGAGLDRLGGDDALGPRAVGDDPESGARFAQRLDRGEADERIAVPVAGRQVDDRDVEIPERRDQLERVAAIGCLLDLVAVGEHAPDPDPNGRLLVDHQAASFVVHCIAPMPGGGRFPRATAAPRPKLRVAAPLSRLGPS